LTGAADAPQDAAMRNSMPILPVLLAAALACGPRGTTTTATATRSEGSMADAIEMVAEGKYAEAEPLLERLLREHQAQPAEAHHYLGVCAEMREDYADAETHYREALRRDPGLFESRVNLGNVLFYLGRNDEALATLTELTEAFPEEPDGFLALGMQQKAMGDDAGALASFQRAVELDPSPVPPPLEQTIGEHPGFLALFEIAAIHQAAGRTEEELAALREALQRSDGAPLAATELAKALSRAGQQEQAIATLVEATRAPGASAADLGAIALQLRDGGAIDEALAAAQAGVERAASDAEYRTAALALALIARPNGRAAEAEAALREAHRRVPDDRGVTLYLGGVLAETQRCAEAIPLLQSALAAYMAEDPASRGAREARAALAACGAAGE
jgi:tetratricopeptide (TPR) repeat protein